MPRRGGISSRTKARRTVAQKTARAARQSLSRRQAVAKTAQTALRLAKRATARSFGSTQLNLQHLEHNLTVKASEPHCIFVPTPTVGAVNQVLASKVVSGARVTTPVAQWQHPTPPAGAIYDQWKESNDDSINGEYKLLYSKYRFSFSNASNRQCRYRIDFIRPYRTTRPTTGSNYLLPDSLGDLQFLATNQHLNPFKYKMVRKPLFITVNPEDGITSENVYRTVYLPSYTVYNPTYEATNRTDLDIPITKQVWMIISNDVPDSLSSNLPSLQISRVVAWRDGAGHAA